jgi:DNA damage-binding protein 1
VSLGTQAISLTPFWSKGQLNVFAACDRPTVLYSAGKKLLFSNMNAGEVLVMAPFHAESFPDCLALASASMLTIGVLDDIQKLHIRTIPLPAELPRRICHHKASRSLAVCTVSMARKGRVCTASRML